MKRFLFAVFCLFLAIGCFADKIKYTDLPVAVSNGMLQVEATALGGLGKDNLKCVLQNPSDKEVHIRIPAGLQFNSDKDSGQDLLTIKEVFVTIGPSAGKEIKMTGYCMQQKKHSPYPNTAYLFRGYARPALKTLSDSLSTYPSLADSYAQMFVWAITDNNLLWNIQVEKKLVKPAQNIMDFVANNSNQPAASVSSMPVSGKSAPSIKVFSKTTSMAYHNPTDQVLSFKIYDQEGKVKYTWFENKKITHGLKEYTFGINDIIRQGSAPFYYARILDSAGKVLVQKKIDGNTPEEVLNPVTREFGFSFELAKGIRNARLAAFLESGELVEEFKRYEYLPVGQYNFTVELRHLYPAGTPFVLKMLSENGTVLAKQTVK